MLGKSRPCRVHLRSRQQDLVLQLAMTFLTSTGMKPAMLDSRQRFRATELKQLAEVSQRSSGRATGEYFVSRHDFAQAPPGPEIRQLRLKRSLSPETSGSMWYSGAPEAPPKMPPNVGGSVGGTFPAQPETRVSCSRNGKPVPCN